MHSSKNYGSKPRAKGLFRDYQTHNIFKMQSPLFHHVCPTLPAVWDLRTKAAPPENQMQCGGCWAFSITNNLRDMFKVAGSDPGALSKNYLLLNVGPVIENGCNGGDFDAGQNMIKNMGPCLESLSPFIGTDQDIVYPNPAPVVATAKLWTLVGNGFSPPSALQLCEALWNAGKGATLSVDVAADNTIEDYSSGIIEQSTSSIINHMVRLVGYNAGNSVDANGNALFDSRGMWVGSGAYFILRNNWDTDWGIDGDCYIAYGVNNLAETAMLFQGF
jgi:C1A family cysteine protease